MLERLDVTRIVTTQAALDAAVMPGDGIVLRIAPDEALVVGGGEVHLDDAHAIVVADQGWHGVWLDADRAEVFLSHHCAWPWPTERPAFAQGMVAHIPVKLWFEDARTLFVVPHVSATDFEAILAASV